MKIDERHLAQVAAVVMYGGVTEAAANLGISQPALSRTITILERRLGEPLFIKGKRPLVPTPLGVQIAKHGRVILAASHKAAETVQSYRSGDSGNIRIGGLPFFMDALIANVIADYQTKRPELRVDQSYGNLEDLIVQIEADQIDIAIAPLGLSEAGDGIRFQPFLPARNVVAARPRHPLLTKSQITTKDVVAYPWIAPLPGSPLLFDLHSILLTLGISEVAIRYSGGSLMSVCKYLFASDALAILPESVVFSLRDTMKLSVVPLDIPQPQRTLGLLTSTLSPPSPATKGFAKFIVQELEELKRLIQPVKLHKLKPTKPPN